LKKRTKKLLHLAGGTHAECRAGLLEATDKSFLVLFFKKELLSCLPIMPACNLLPELNEVRVTVDALRLGNVMKSLP
jgi:hypothetical protein